MNIYMNTYMKAGLALMVVFSLFPIRTAYSEQHIPQAVIDSANKVSPGFATENARQSPIAGLFQISLGSSVVYLSADGRYALDGDLIDLEQGVNLTELERQKALTDVIEHIDEDSMIVFAPDQVKSTITVFTDISCPYCVKLHEEVAQLNENGVKVRYLAYPRAGIPSANADDMASIWCADDPAQAMTDAKAGRAVIQKECTNPVSAHYELGVQIGVKGTPTIILEDGSRLGGYMPYLQLTEAAQQAHTVATQAQIE